MNSTAKITSLVAVLVLCCAGLAGSAYAYTATYVDTIDSQDIEDVYLTVVGSRTGTEIAKSPAVDVDVEYNYYNGKTVTAKDSEGHPTSYGPRTIGYNVNAFILGNTEVTGDMIDKTETSVTFVTLIEKFTVTAYGDAASYDFDVSATGHDADVGNGVKAYLILRDTTITDVSSVAAVDADDLSIADQNLGVGDSNDYYVYMVIKVNQLKTTGFEGVDGVTYYEELSADIIDDVTIAGYDLIAKATAKQA